ncbi:nuclear transport factor 2 family protein [Marivirga sp. S37H4]|uniref:Nuclear transport factor 2 family protein n=1 Tax=Marivirga aurantiaca TaxID=2802615 RepID=A0A934X1U9_9BACT|nr:nuclear transport factor 2 family protein [Marivirga aurantiaca]MBK6266765.1 nuclear transport factor 2 family protein [Marivirga aurantiaca]
MNSIKAQISQKSDSLAIMAIISDVFDGMRSSDSSMISKHMHQDVKMQSIGYDKSGDTKLTRATNADGWLNAVAQPKKQVWDERTWNYQMQLNEMLANVWMDYAFYVDENFSHCGVNSFTLVKLNDIWKIIYIIDTRKQEDCKNPETLK